MRRRRRPRPPKRHCRECGADVYSWTEAPLCGVCVRATVPRDPQIGNAPHEDFDGLGGLCPICGLVTKLRTVLREELDVLALRETAHPTQPTSPKVETLDELSPPRTTMFRKPDGSPLIEITLTHTFSKLTRVRRRRDDDQTPVAATPRRCERCDITLRPDEKIGERMGDPAGFFCSGEDCPLMGRASRQFEETVETQRPCVVCGVLTGDRTVQIKADGRPGRKTYRCRDFDACAARRNAGRKRPRGQVAAYPSERSERDDLAGIAGQVAPSHRRANQRGLDPTRTLDPTLQVSQRAPLRPRLRKAGRR